MPIVFAQPDPVSPGISSAAGAADQWARDFPTLVHQQDTLARIQEADASLRARGSQGAMQAMLQAQAQTTGLQARADEGAAQRDHQMLMLSQQQSGQAGLQAQHFDLQNQLMNNQLSQAENLRLQRLRGARGSIQEMVTSGDLSQEEGRALAFKVETGIDPLQQRQARSQLQTQELQRRGLEQQVAFQDNLLQQRTKFMNGTLGDRLRTETDEFGQDHTVVLGLDGNIDWHATQLWQQQSGRSLESLQAGPGQDGGGGAGRRRTGAAAGGGGGGGSGGNATPVMDPALRRIAIQEATALAGTDANGRRQAPTQAQIDEAYERLAGPPADASAPRQQNRSQVQSEVWTEMRHAFRGMGLTPDQMRNLRDAEVNRRMGVQRTQMERHRDDALYAAQQMSNLRQAGYAFSPENGRVMSRQIIQARQQERERRQQQDAQAANARPGQPAPFPTTEGGAIDRERLTASQNQALGQFDRVRTLIADAPADRREDLTHHVDRAQELLTQYGNVQAMPQAARKRFGDLLRVLDAYEANARRRPARPAYPGVGSQTLTEDERVRAEAVAGM